MQLNINLWLLQALLVGLRAFGVVEWDWILVFLPILIPLCLVVGMMIIVVLVISLTIGFRLLEMLIDSVKK